MPNILKSYPIFHAANGKRRPISLAPARSATIFLSVIPGWLRLPLWTVLRPANLFARSLSIPTGAGGFRIFWPAAARTPRMTSQERTHETGCVSLHRARPGDRRLARRGRRAGVQTRFALPPQSQGVSNQRAHRGFGRSLRRRGVACRGTHPSPYRRGPEQARVPFRRARRRAGRQGRAADGTPLPERLAAATRQLHARSRHRRRHDRAGADRDLQPPAQEQLPPRRLGQPRRRQEGRAGRHGRGEHGLQHALSRLRRAQPGRHHPRRRRLHVELHHERRAPDGHPHGMRLVRSRGARRGHGPRRAPRAAGSRQPQRGRRALLRRARPDLAHAPPHRRDDAAQHSRAGPRLQGRLRRRSPTISTRKTSTTSVPGSSGAAGKRHSWTPPGSTLLMASARSTPI